MSEYCNKKLPGVPHLSETLEYLISRTETIKNQNQSDNKSKV